ncbi:MAG: hypothetical protein K0S32_611 [Bacteroidetes bacterium]|nr:hypothetical protein [Bacteroidota bacterium]
MKKFLFTVASVLILAGASAQEKDKGDDFDKKFRFGLRVTPQPTWYTSSQTNNKPFGSKFGFGFGLNLEFRLSKIVAFSTGIGGDFEGGHQSFRYDPSNNYVVNYFMNNENGFIEPKTDQTNAELTKDGATGYLLKERTIKSSYVTLPALLKLSTAEYSGFKYFGMFGVELGMMYKCTATDTYYESYKYNAVGSVTATAGESEQADINIMKDAIPVRAGLNVGLGTEYRIGGSTSAFMNINFFRSFTNLMKSNSKYLVSNIDASTGANKYTFVKQNLVGSAIRINIGILF